MKRIIITFSLILVSFLSSAQEKLLVVENGLKTSNSKLEQSFVISNKTNDNLSITLKDSKYIYSYLYNENLKKIAEIKTKAFRNETKTQLGSSVNESNYFAYLSNNNRTKFGVYSFNYKDKQSLYNEVDLNLENEKFLQSVSLKNSFYIFTILKNKSILKIYKLKNNSFIVNTIDLSKERFIDAKSAPTSLYKALQDNRVLKLEKMEQQNPNSIESASNRAKLYTSNEGVIITIDNSPNVTQILKINLSDYTYAIDSIDKPSIVSSFGSIKSNSFIYDNSLFLLMATSNQLIFNVLDLKSKTLIKEYRLEKEDTIKFKNSKIIQEGGMYDGYRELEKTSKFLRKISQGAIGISIYKLDDKFQITLGGYKEVSSGGGMMMPGFGSMASGFNPTMFAYGSYTNTKSTYINCLFDNDFNHLEGSFDSNVFDKLSEFTSENKAYFNAETIFEYKDALIFGTSIKEDKKFRLYKFTD